MTSKMQLGLVTYQTDSGNMCEIMMLQAIEDMPESHVVRRRLYNAVTTGLSMEGMDFPGKMRLSETYVDFNRTHALWEVDATTLIYATSDSEGSINVIILAPERKAAFDLMSQFTEHVKYRPLPPVEQINMKFWHQTAVGPTTVTRSIEVPEWQAIQNNYSKDARHSLDRLMSLDGKDLTAGRIVLMHGPAGTGKTTAIRALSRHWRNWCQFEYVIDPDELFGEHGAAYLVQVVLDNMELATESGVIPWRLLVIEDAEEFIRADAKQRVGQALARLLNIGDGLIGQGLKVMTLLTTNAEVGTLHPAITRAGRCIANIEVPAMESSEAGDWLKHHGHADVQLAYGQKKTLADLYQITRENAQIGNKSEEKNVGLYL